MVPLSSPLHNIDFRKGLQFLVLNVNTLITCFGFQSSGFRILPVPQPQLNDIKKKKAAHKSKIITKNAISGLFRYFKLWGSLLQKKKNFICSRCRSIPREQMPCYTLRLCKKPWSSTYSLINLLENQNYIFCHLP